jgi:hypothetical protein
MAALTDGEWAAIRAEWEADPRQGLKWLTRPSRTWGCGGWAPASLGQDHATAERWARPSFRRPVRPPRFWTVSVYTEVTRGKRLVVLVRQRRALAIAVRGQQTRRRWSKLKEWLKG